MFRAFLSNERTLELGLLFIRVGIGLLFVRHGWGKITDVAEWQWLGEQLAPLGITFWPSFWGFLAAATEFVGGLCLVFGFATRLVAIAMGCVMAVALSYHIKKGDSFGTYAHPLALLVIFIGFVLAGPGAYSLDHYLHEKKKKDISL